MHWLLLACLAGGCTSMTLRTGVVSFGGRPAFQASIEIGPSVIGEHHGLSAASEWGLEADERGTRAVSAINLDAIQNDEEVGPVGRIGVRFRSAITEDERRRSGALLLRGAGFVGLGRDAARRFAGLGIEFAGGLAFAPVAQPIFEANLVLGGKVDR